MTTTTVYLDGSYLPKGEARLSPDDRGFLFADGIYEVIRAYGGQFYAMQPHLQRMSNGLRALRIEGADVAGVADVAQELLRRNGLEGGNALVYVQITRGAAIRGHGFPDPPVPPTMYATAMPFKAKGDPETGVAVITAPDHRWTRCDIKSVALLPNCMAFQDAVEAGAQEAVLVRDGVALEGTHTSFFGVIDGVVRTAPRSNYILPSITRQAGLDICGEQGIPMAEEPVMLHELRTADELFLTGTTMEIMPIVQIDGRPVGDGKPGPIARKLLKHFHARTP
jgi:D-alanine transaminase